MNSQKANNNVAHMYEKSFEIDAEYCSTYISSKSYIQAEALSQLILVPYRRTLYSFSHLSNVKHSRQLTCLSSHTKLKSKDCFRKDFSGNRGYFSGVRQTFEVPGWAFKKK